MTHLNDLSKAYLEQIAEKKKDDTYLEPDMKKRQANNEKARKDLMKGPQMKNPHFEEKQLDPVGQEDADVDNDGKKNTKSDKYLLKRRKAIAKAIKEAKHATAKQMHSPHEVPSGNIKGLVKKAVKRIDTDVDGDTDKNDKAKGEFGEFITGAGNKRLYSTTKTTTAKESFSNWRNDLIEVVKDEEKAIKEKNVKNKITINPELKESVENIGGVLLEVTEFSDVLEEITDEELYFLSDSMIEEIVEEVFAEAEEEGQDLDVFETVLCESIDASLMLLNEVTSPAKVNALRLKNKASASSGQGQTAGRDAGAEARKRLSSDSSGSGSSSRAEKLEKIKSAVKKVGAAVKAGAKKAGEVAKKAAPVVRKAAVKSAEVAGKAAGHAKNLAKDMGSAAKKGYQSTQTSSSSSSSSSSGDSSRSMTRPVAKKKPGLLSRIGSKLKRGLKKAVGKTARAVSRGARNVARRMNEEAATETDTKDENKPSAQEKQTLANKQKMLQKQMMLQKQKLQLQKQGKLPMNGMHEETINERGDFWHPDSEQDRKLGGPGANQRAREDRGSSKPAAKKDTSKSLKPGETYMQYAKRKQAEKAERAKKYGYADRLKKEEIELDERTRYAKETGKDYTTGNPSEKGGTMKGSAMSKVGAELRKTGGMMSSRKKAIQPQGKKKEKGAKPKFKTAPTPVDKIKAKLAQKRAPKKDPYGYGQGRYQGD